MPADPHIELHQKRTTVDSYCGTCDDVTPHHILANDPSSCQCPSCNNIQQLVRPAE